MVAAIVNHEKRVVRRNHSASFIVDVDARITRGIPQKFLVEERYGRINDFVVWLLFHNQCGAPRLVTPKDNRLLIVDIEIWRHDFWMQRRATVPAAAMQFLCRKIRKQRMRAAQRQMWHGWSIILRQRNAAHFRCLRHAEAIVRNISRSIEEEQCMPVLLQPLYRRPLFRRGIEKVDETVQFVFRELRLAKVVRHVDVVWCANARRLFIEH